MISEDLSEGYNSCLNKEQIKFGYYLSSAVRFILCLCGFLYLFADLFQKVIICAWIKKNGSNSNVEIRDLCLLLYPLCYFSLPPKYLVLTIVSQFY